ncbi:hypothetical protein TSOC_004726 [Tetrabaena socialis]|uniref:GST N-terminal domain-containing protein n=1 Tax=Tetrabaena socialis TaxID=47790 RepID=A0A2J8A835_9CHLO|nr:hypothetical protein TSOC_004726 [Tetrabaena socialis]|eukprot:PNH08687.1 hypothetical protein TSOC_004726 [Tetrabaena socialis]
MLGLSSRLSAAPSGRLGRRAAPRRAVGAPAMSGLLSGLLKGFSSGGQAGASAPAAALSFSDNAPTWDQLAEMVRAQHAELGVDFWADPNEGPTSPLALKRMFGTTEPVRLKLYRDHAAWCPYCQKVWLQLEEKRIPYVMEKINMRCYGDKPSSFMAKARAGAHATPGGAGRGGVSEGKASAHAHQPVRVGANANGALGKRGPNAGGNGGQRGQRVSMCRAGPGWLASARRRRREARWFAAMEQRPTYMGTRSDYYTHAHDLPPQLGGCGMHADGLPVSAALDGTDGAAWRLPLPPLSATSLPEPYSPGERPPYDRLEAAAKLVRNNEAIVRFSLRGPGQPGPRPVSAPLADPTAVPALQHTREADAALRHVAHALLAGVEAKQVSPQALQAAPAGALPGAAVVLAAEYLRDRVGVPRDMKFPAARQLRAHLNWLIDSLQPGQ